jgi:hypothetical protein
VPITVDDGAGVAGFQIDVSYSGSLLNAAVVRPATDTASGWFITGAAVEPGKFRILGYSDPPAGFPSGPRQVALLDLDIADSAPVGTLSPFDLGGCVVSNDQGVQVPCNTCPQPGHVTVRPAASFRFGAATTPVGVDKYDPQSFTVNVDALTFAGDAATGYNGTAAMSVGPYCSGTLAPASLPFVSGSGSANFTIGCCLDPQMPHTRVSLDMTADDASFGITGDSGPFDGVAKGDVNADDSVNVLDVVPAVNLTLGLPLNAPPLAPPVSFQTWAANMLDQTCAVDGSINVLDIVRIRNKALGRPPLCACTAGATMGMEQAAVPARPVAPFTISLVKDGPRDYLLQVHGAVDLSGLQIALRGAGAKEKVSLAGLLAGQGWQAQTTLVQDVLTIVTFSNSATGISGDGPVLRISGSGKPRLVSVVASDSSGRAIPLK